MLFAVCNKCWVVPCSVIDLLYMFPTGFKKRKDCMILWKGALFAIVWSNLLEQNWRIFCTHCNSRQFLWEGILFLASLWCFDCERV